MSLLNPLSCHVRVSLSAVLTFNLHFSSSSRVKLVLPEHVTSGCHDNLLVLGEETMFNCSDKLIALLHISKIKRE